MNRYGGSVAVVTGASRGIGLAVARRLVDEGARVVITGRKQDALDLAIHELGGGKHAIASAGRSDDAAHRSATIDLAVECFGRLDLLVNNVGINPAYGPMLDVSDAEAMKIFETNLIGTLAWTREGYRRWFAVNGGAVVNIASVAGVRPAAGIGMYGASKAALMLLTQQLALELSPRVRVNALAPAVVRTRFARVLFEGKESELAAAYPLGRLGDPRDIAAAVAFLGSEDAGWITGQTIVVDGGRTLTGGIE